MTDDERERLAALRDDAERLDRESGITDDECHGRCADLLDWFTWETRGLLVPEEAHDVLDMVLNRVAADRPADTEETPDVRD